MTNDRRYIFCAANLPEWQWHTLPVLHPYWDTQNPLRIYINNLLYTGHLSVMGLLTTENTTSMLHSSQFLTVSLFKDNWIFAKHNWNSSSDILSLWIIQKHLTTLDIQPYSFTAFILLNPEWNPICYLLALLAHHFLHVSRIMVKSLTLRLLMSYIYGAHILDVSRSHTTTHHSR